MLNFNKFTMVIILIQGEFYASAFLPFRTGFFHQENSVRYVEILRRSGLKMSVRWDFRCWADAFRGVSDEPSPPLR
ncbi:hypothetical protein, partial [Psychrobacillus soli]|uniref:hypothetical protein n=1 Tax=Psychrobacillus soli TaxID=1543965 RepID=UPI001C8D5239